MDDHLDLGGCKNITSRFIKFLYCLETEQWYLANNLLIKIYCENIVVEFLN